MAEKLTEQGLIVGIIPEAGKTPAPGKDAPKAPQPEKKKSAKKAQ